MRKLSIGALIAAVTPAMVGGQVVSGSVVDSVSRQPISGVSILVIDVADSLNRHAAVSDDSGHFTIRLRGAGSYTVMARRLGLAPRQASPAPLAAGAVRTVRFEMSRVPTLLDTVRAIGEKENLTAGREWFARHYREGKGFFTSGNEILLSRLSACDYFGGIPGLGITQVRMARGGESMISCRDGRAISMATRPSCFQTVIDRRQGQLRLDSTTLTFSSPRFGNRYIPLADVRGVEVYRTRVELPAGDDDFSVPLDAGPRASGRAQTRSTSKTMGRPVPMTRISTMKCATVLIWTNATW